MYSWRQREVWLDLQCWLVRIYCSCQRKVTTRLQIGRRGLTGGSTVASSLLACFSLSRTTRCRFHSTYCKGTEVEEWHKCVAPPASEGAVLAFVYLSTVMILRFTSKAPLENVTCMMSKQNEVKLN
jgi:hypothetical protein